MCHLRWTLSMAANGGHQDVKKPASARFKTPGPLQSSPPGRCSISLRIPTALGYLYDNDTPMSNTDTKYPNMNIPMSLKRLLPNQ